MVREDFIALAMAPADGEPWSLPYLQRLLFLLDTRLDTLGGPHFDFKPYDYGPMSNEVRPCLEHMRHAGLVIVEGGGWVLSRFRLTWKGQEHGRALLAGISTKDGEYVQHIAAWIRPLTFTELSAAMQSSYPEMCARPGSSGVTDNRRGCCPCS